MRWDSGAVSGRELDLRNPHKFRIHEGLYSKEIKKIIYSLAQKDDKDFSLSTCRKSGTWKFQSIGLTLCGYGIWIYTVNIFLELSLEIDIELVLWESWTKQVQNHSGGKFPHCRPDRFLTEKRRYLVVDCIIVFSSLLFPINTPFTLWLCSSFN